MANTKAQAAKDKGNVAFKAGDFPTAIGHYTEAILADRTDPTYPLNRAAAYLKLGKAEDAERDCNTVLGLNPKNVKALFRRGQARVGMNKLLEAQADFSNILVAEPVNGAAKEELKKVNDLIQTEKSKKAKSPANVMNASLEPKATPRRRRVPIRIVDPSQAAASSSSPVPEQKAPVAAAAVTTPIVPKSVSSSNKQPDTLEAVSSRSLKPEAPPVPPALTALAAALQPETEGSAKADPVLIQAPRASSFKDAKQVRENAKPSRVGGGIFRASGKNTIFTMKDDGSIAVDSESVSTSTPASKSASTPKPTPPAEATKLEPSIPVASQAPVNKAREAPSTPAPVDAAPPVSKAIPAVILKAPATLFDFNKAWTNSRSTDEKWQLMNTIPPIQFPGFCKSSMEAELFSSILSVFADVLRTRTGDAGTQVTVRAYMDNFPKIARFNTVVLFFSRAEKAVAKTVWELLGVEKPTGAWAPVAV